MKKFLLASAAGAMLMIPGLSRASTVNFDTAGSQYTLLFDPNGCTPSNLPSPCFYRSYNCRIGDKVTFPVVTITTKTDDGNPKGNNNPPSNNPPSNNPPHDTDNTPPYTPPGNNPPPNDSDTTPPQNPVGGGTTITPPGGCDPAMVPAPDTAAMGGIGVAAVTVFAWLRSRRQARA